LDTTILLFLELVSGKLLYSLLCEERGCLAFADLCEPR
jgi:hypothetical protein